MSLTIILIVAAVAGILGYIMAQGAIKNQAIDGCLHTATANFKNEQGYNMTVPENYWYKFCMKEKGFTVTDKK